MFLYVVPYSTISWGKFWLNSPASTAMCWILNVLAPLEFLIVFFKKLVFFFIIIIKRSKQIAIKRIILCSSLTILIDATKFNFCILALGGNIRQKFWVSYAINLTWFRCIFMSTRFRFWLSFNAHSFSLLSFVVAPVLNDPIQEVTSCRIRI